MSPGAGRDTDSSPPAAVPPLRRRPRIGIALGGRFARSSSDIGVLKVLEEGKLPIDYVAGTSVGAVIGAAYCGGLSAKEMAETAELVRFRDFARWTFSRFALCSNDRMQGFLGRLLKVHSFEELRIPLAVAGTHLSTRQGGAFRSGPLFAPASAVVAHPAIFLPRVLSAKR